jgi:hypothetical protein
MTRLPSKILLMVFVGLTSCAQRPIQPMAPDPNKKFQKDDTAYISVFLFKDSAGTCKAKVSPETLLVVKVRGNPHPSKRNVEFEVVNLCWDQQTPEEITVEFLGGKNPTEPHGNPKEVAKMPNPDNQAVDKSRDDIRRKLKDDPGQDIYNYAIKRKVGGGSAVTVVDPRLEYEYRN